MFITIYRFQHHQTLQDLQRLSGLWIPEALGTTTWRPGFFPKMNGTRPTQDENLVNVSMENEKWCVRWRDYIPNIFTTGQLNQISEGPSISINARSWRRYIFKTFRNWMLIKSSPRAEESWGKSCRFGRADWKSDVPARLCLADAVAGRAVTVELLKQWWWWESSLPAPKETIESREASMCRNWHKMKIYCKLLNLPLLNWDRGRSGPGELRTFLSICT